MKEKINKIGFSVTATLSREGDASLHAEMIADKDTIAIDDLDLIYDAYEKLGEIIYQIKRSGGKPSKVEVYSRRSEEYENEDEEIKNKKDFS